MKPSTLALPTLLIVSSSSRSTLAFSAQPAFLIGSGEPSSSSSYTHIFTPSTSHIFPTITSSSANNNNLPRLSAYIGQDFGIPSSANNNNNNNNNSNNDDGSQEVVYVQNMTPEERTENLDVMRQIFKVDLAELQRRRDYSGWVEAKRDLKRRQANDPWFELNAQLKEAVQMDETEEAGKIQKIIDQVGGPPPGVVPMREYAVISEIYSTPMSLSRAENIAKIEQSKRNKEIWKQMIAERKANEKAEEEDYWNDPHKTEREARARGAVRMQKMYKEMEEARKKALEKAMEIQKKHESESQQTTLSMDNPLDRAIAATKKTLEAKKIQAQLEATSSDDAAGTATPTITYSASGQPRIPGDKDVTLGKIDADSIAESSDCTTDGVRIEVRSSYDSTESKPEVRKHCFTYTIRISNLSPHDTIRLTSRKFEIQVVGNSKKDLVHGEGITGSQPILKPGELFSYTSSAPLSVRPIGTTEVAARMRGTYVYQILGAGGESATEREAELGAFHFVFPVEQRVLPYEGLEGYDDDDDDEEDESNQA